MCHCSAHCCYSFQINENDADETDPGSNLVGDTLIHTDMKMISFKYKTAKTQWAQQCGIFCMKGKKLGPILLVFGLFQISPCAFLDPKIFVPLGSVKRCEKEFCPYSSYMENMLNKNSIILFFCEAKKVQKRISIMNILVFQLHIQ